MPIDTNVSWFNVNMIKNYFNDQNAYICIDDPYMVRPVGVTQFIGVQSEPNAILQCRHPFIINASKYDILLAHDEEILKACPNAIHYVPSVCWILPDVYNNIDISRKLPKISSIVGWKTWTDGHMFRRDLYFNQKSIDLPITWHRSSEGEILPEITSNPVLSGSMSSKSDLFLDYQYSLVIENTRTANYFTEKLIDCLITKTIPIYWGCTNIEKWFDTTGWIILETTDVNELVEKCKSLPIYSEFIEEINKNHQTAKHYVTMQLNIIHSLGFKSAE